MNKFLKICKALLYIVLMIVGGFIVILISGAKRKIDDRRLKKVKDLQNKASKTRGKAEFFKRKARGGDRNRRTIRDKFSKTVPIILLLFLILSSLGFSEYIVYDEEEKVNRDYGNVTNYIRSLEAEKREFLAIQGYLHEGMTYYSNAYDSMSNASTLQGEIIEDHRVSWWDQTKFYIGVISGVIITGILFSFLK